MPSGYRIKLTSEKIDQLILDYLSGISARQLALKFGFKCQKSILKILKNNNIKIRPKKEATKLAKTINFSQEEKDKIINLYKDPQISIINIAKKLNYDSATIKNFLISHNIYDKNKFDNYLINKFKIIDTEEKAYWLGFLTADGSLSKKQLSLQLSEKDKEHIILFKKFIGVDYKISQIITILNNKKFIGYRYSISSTNFVNSLKKQNLLPNKSFITKFPKTIPQHLIFHYIRGIVDGDGSFYIHKNKLSFSLISSIIMCKQIQKILIENCNVKKTKLYIKYCKNGKMAYLKYCGNKQVKRIHYYLYNNSNIFLLRKRNIILPPILQ